ncbi:MAG TPA: hypothetical protein VKD72_37365 [Gemmataceae bacterium]|nr:hypothetical protein [Gemmataceae bacterium]
MRQEFRGYGVFLFVLGIILLIVAGVLAGKTTVRVETEKGVEKSHAEVPNTTAGLASCGFAIAAGFCFVAASLIYLGDTLARRSEESARVSGTAKERPGQASPPPGG